MEIKGFVNYIEDIVFQNTEDICELEEVMSGIAKELQKRYLATTCNSSLTKCNYTYDYNGNRIETHKNGDNQECAPHNRRTLGDIKLTKKGGVVNVSL